MKKKEIAKLFLGIAIGSIIAFLVFIIMAFSMAEKVVTAKMGEQLISIALWLAVVFLISTFLAIILFVADSKSQFKSLMEDGSRRDICPHCHINISSDCKSCPNCKKEIER